MRKSVRRVFVGVSLMVAVSNFGCGVSDLTEEEVLLHDDARVVPEEFQLTQALGTSGRGTLFLNFDGATLTSGASSSKQNTSWIIPKGNTAVIPAVNAARYGTTREALIQQVVSLVKQDYAAYDVEVVTQRPSSGDYTMVMVGGTKSVLGDPSIPSGVVGVAPLDVGDPNRNDVVFAFADSLSRSADLATCISHEVGHSFGLQHMEPTNAIMYPALRVRPLQWVNARIYGSSQTQDQPGILQRLFGAPPTTTPSNPTNPTPPTQPAAENGATFVSQVVPATIHPGEQFQAQLTFKNSGTSTWSSSTGFALTSRDATWGGRTIALTSDVAPGQQRTFQFYATAPSATGTYRFQFNLTQNGVAFGQASAEVQISVQAAATGRVPNGRLELVTARSGRGWAFDSDIPSQPVPVQIYIDGRYAGTLSASRYRSDLADDGVEGLYHGFAFGMPYIGGTHRITAFAVDNDGTTKVQLPGEFVVSQ